MRLVILPSNADETVTLRSGYDFRAPGNRRVKPMLSAEERQKQHEQQRQMANSFFKYAASKQISSGRWADQANCGCGNGLPNIHGQYTCTCGKIYWLA